MTPAVSPCTCHASTGCGSPLTSSAASARQSNIRPTSRRVPAAITTSPGAATACSRAARSGVSPIATRCTRVAGLRLLADDNQPGGDADARLKGNAGGGLQRTDRIEDGDAGAHGLLGVMLIGCRIAKIDEHAIAQVLGDKSVEARRHIGDRSVEGGEQIAHVLGVKTRRQRHRVDDVAQP